MTKKQRREQKLANAMRAIAVKRLMKPTGNPDEYKIDQRCAEYKRVQKWHAEMEAHGDISNETKQSKEPR